jgi:hypothetical protein
MSQPHTFGAKLIPIVVGVLLVVATVLFITVPYSLGHHPWEGAPITANPHSAQLS